jgi:hypothetical protein
MITVIHLTRPVRDRVVNEVLWRTTDEMMFAPETRRLWKANGLRAGVVFGNLAPEVEAILQAPPPNKVYPAQFLLADGDDGSLVSLSPKVAEASVLLNLQGRPYGKDFRDAESFLRVTATQEGADAVALRFIPEIHHGPVQQSYGAMPNGTRGFSPRELTIKTGQKEETLRELTTTIVLKPNQVAVIGGFGDRPRSLGSFCSLSPSRTATGCSRPYFWSGPSRCRKATPQTRRDRISSRSSRPPDRRENSRTFSRTDDSLPGAHRRWIGNDSPPGYLRRNGCSTAGTT